MKVLLLIALLISTSIADAATTGVRTALNRFVVSLTADTDDAKADLDQLAAEVKSLAQATDNKDRMAIERTREAIVKAKMTSRISLQAIDTNIECWNFDARAYQSKGMEMFYEMMKLRFKIPVEELRGWLNAGHLPSEIAVAYRLSEMRQGVVTAASVLKMRDEDKGWAEIAKVVGAQSLTGVLDLSDKQMMAEQTTSAAPKNQ